MMRFFLRNIFILLIIFSACKPSRHISRKNTTEPLPYLTATELIQKVNAEYLNFDEIEGKAQFYFRGEKDNLSFTVYLRMKSDSIIWMTINTIASIELARIKITRDSVFILDRFQKKAHLKSFSSILDSLSGNYYLQTIAYNMSTNLRLFQDLLIGNSSITMGTDSSYNVTIHNYSFLNYGPCYELFSLHDTLHSQYVISPDKFKIIATIMHQNYSDHYKIECNNFSQIKNSYLPLERLLDYSTVSDTSKIHDIHGNIGFAYTRKLFVKLTYSKLEVPKEKLNYPFIIPSDYEIIR